MSDQAETRDRGMLMKCFQPGKMLIDCLRERVWRRLRPSYGKKAVGAHPRVPKGSTFPFPFGLFQNPISTRCLCMAGKMNEVEGRDSGH